MDVHGRLRRHLQVVSQMVVVVFGINLLCYREVLGIVVGDNKAEGFWPGPGLAQGARRLALGWWAVSCWRSRRNGSWNAAAFSLSPPKKFSYKGLRCNLVVSG